MGMIEELRAAADALNQGNPEPFAALMADDSEWRGVPQRHLWRKVTPACHGPSEALEVMQSRIKERGDNHLQVPTRVHPGRREHDHRIERIDRRRRSAPGSLPGAQVPRRQDRGHAGLLVPPRGRPVRSPSLGPSSLADRSSAAETPGVAIGTGDVAALGQVLAEHPDLASTPLGGRFKTRTPCTW
jgi:hypothetical protein